MEDRGAVSSRETLGQTRETTFQFWVKVAGEQRNLSSNGFRLPIWNIASLQHLTWSAAIQPEIPLPRQEVLPGLLRLEKHKLLT